MLLATVLPCFSAATGVDELRMSQNSLGERLAVPDSEG